MLPLLAIASESTPSRNEWLSGICVGERTAVVSVVVRSQEATTVRPLLVQWLEQHGLPGFLAPGYLMLASLSTIVAAAHVLHMARQDHADVHGEIRSILAVYVGTLAGGYAFEVLRAIGVSLLTVSISPLFQIGRAAYGGLLGGLGLVALYRRKEGLPLGEFLDRATPGVGLIFLAVRTGCFLAGCDYGIPTSHHWGVRFPAFSQAAHDHASRGWIPEGAASLPVHPTQLYEGVLGALAALLAWVLFGRQRGDGRTFAAFLSLYACGRFMIEFWRGDSARGLYLHLSTAQYVSIVILLAMGSWLFGHRARYLGQRLLSE